MTREIHTTQERRRYPRIESLQLLSYVAREDGVQKSAVAMGRTLNISAVGVKVEAYQHIPPGSRMELEIAVEDQVLSVQGKVVHSTETESGRYSMGIEFDELQEELPKIFSDASP